MRYNGTKIPNALDNADAIRPHTVDSTNISLLTFWMHSDEA
jgi:hypothetical protein